MMVRDAIIHKIKENVFATAQVTEKSNLYTDLSFDSLSFIVLLTKIEETCSVTFDIMEMETCLQVGQLITIVENKVKERENSNDQEFTAKP